MRQKPTSFLKAFYDNLHLVNLFPLLDNEIDVELGGDAWKKLIFNYKIYGKSQKVNIPSFEIMNTLFDPTQIVSVNSKIAKDRKSENELSDIFGKKSEGIMEMANDSEFLRKRRGAEAP